MGKGCECEGDHAIARHPPDILDFVPFKDRVATTRMVIIDSEVHQLFGHYSGKVRTDEGKILTIDGLLGFAEEHHARW